MKILNWEAILWDCLMKLKDIQSESIDMIITSPPYDNLRTYWWNLQWDFEWIAKELLRVTKQWWVCVWIVWDATVKWSETWTSFRQALFFKEIGFNLHDTMIYAKDWISFPDRNRYQQSFEYMFILSKWSPKSKNLISDRKNISFWRKVTWTDRQVNWETKKASCFWNNIKEFWIRWNIWNVPTNKWNVKINHPAVFPEKLAIDHILSWSNEWDTILDPFAWSFTTAVACENTNRKWICIEKEQSYFYIWIERLSKLKEN